MSAIFPVNQPGEYTFKLTIQNNGLGTLTVKQEQKSPMYYQLAPHSQPQAQIKQEPQQFRKPTDRSLDNIIRGLNSLSMNNDQVAVADPPMDSLDTTEPPVELNHAKRHERAKQRVNPCGIPNVPDPGSCRRQQRRFGGSTTPLVSTSPDRSGLIYKAPQGSRPIVSGSIKLMRPEVDQVDENTNDIFLEIIGENEDDRKRKRQPSSANWGSPFPSGTSSHESASPTSSYISAPTPPFANVSVIAGPPSPRPMAASQSQQTSEPPRRRRGRPPKPRPDGAPPPRNASIRQSLGPAKGQLQPRPAPGVSVMICNGRSSFADFVPAAELAEARRVIERYSDDELATLNEKGEPLSFTLAREGNWAKLMALNLRWLSNASLGDIFTGINTENHFGQTTIIEAVMQQEVKAVEYCCLFACSSDEHLYRALVESALLPSNAVFNAILQKMCLGELDENGNPVQRRNRFIDKPIGGWSFRNPRLNKLAGLTLTQALTLGSKEFYPRLAKLIEHGADARRLIGPEADNDYRPYNDSVCLAAAFAEAPFECLQALGMNLNSAKPLSSDPTGEILQWCRNTISNRTDLDIMYHEVVSQRFGSIDSLVEPDQNDLLPFLDPNDPDFLRLVP